MATVSCIIPAYNEGARIKEVLTVVTTHPLINEVIVIDDGSVDETKDATLEFEKVKLITHKNNLGKSASLYDGIKKSTGDYIFFMDADLNHLNPQNVSDMILPVINGVADISISLRKNTSLQYHILGIDYITGERVLSRHMLIPDIEVISSLEPFAFEVFLNDLIIKNQCRLKVVPWTNVGASSKIKKRGLWKGLTGDFFMYVDILRTVSIFDLIYQVINLKKLIVR
jgi:glycosyltransferase involved in cell wall biosynthesis